MWDRWLARGFHYSRYKNVCGSGVLHPSFFRLNVNGKVFLTAAKSIYLVVCYHLQERFVIEGHFRLPLFLERALTTSFSPERNTKRLNCTDKQSNSPKWYNKKCMKGVRSIFFCQVMPNIATRRTTILEIKNLLRHTTHMINIIIIIIAPTPMMTPRQIIAPTTADSSSSVPFRASGGAGPSGDWYHWISNCL